jgi:hypothetical protein
VTAGRSNATPLIAPAAASAVADPQARNPRPARVHKFTAVDTLRTPPSPPDRPRTRPPATATAARVAGFVAALALTAAVGWQAGRMLAATPDEPAAVSTSAPSGS